MSRVMKKRTGEVGRMTSRALFAVVGASLLLMSSSCGLMDEDTPVMNAALDDGDREVRIQQLSSFCSVDIVGHGSVDVEEDYLPSVVACENGNAPLEALKAQAVAARTFAQFITEDEQRALYPTTDDQVYDCGTEPTELHRQAVEETAGEVLLHGSNDILSVGFYVAGAIPNSGSGCVGTGGSDPTNTEHHVTYNENRSGGAVRPATNPMGNPNHPSNRGVKSQNGATCLADQGWDYERILRFYYGDDIRAKVSPGSQCAGVSGDGSSAPPPPDTQGGQVCMFSETADSTGPSCSDPSQAPQIQPRSAWNAQTPSQNRAPHTPNRITVHHTVTANNASNGAQQVRNVQNIHMNQGWSDIGYHYLISWDGTIYAGNPKNRIGAHAGGDNTGNLGIALLGTFHQNTAPSDAQIDSLTTMLRHLSDEFGIDLQRSNVQGHGEWPSQSTICPGQHVRNQLDAVVDAARGDAVCETSEQDIVGQEVESFKYARVTGLDLSPSADNDVVDGFEVDSIYYTRGSDDIYPSEVLCSPNVSNPDHATGEPANDSCDNREQTLAGVPEGGELIVRFGSPLKEGDSLHVIQHLYQAATTSECGPSGTAQVSLSDDGNAWKVLDRSARGNSTWHLNADDFVFDEDDEIGVPGEEFQFIVPKAGEAHHPALTFQAKASNPEIVEVEYYVPGDAEEVIDDDWLIDSSTDAGSNFKASYTFQYYGERRIAARGLDAAGNEVAKEEIVITVTDEAGNIPEGETASDPLPGGSNINTSLAEDLAYEGGRCWDPATGGPRCEGSNGSSLGLCWRFVKRAMERAGIDWAALQNVGPCSSYNFNLSAYGFRCNADPNPAALADIGMQRINVPTTEAPAGAVIAWDRGCLGFNATHGHIEISQGDGTACSDYCGNIRGDAGCASVYVPVN